MHYYSLDRSNGNGYLPILNRGYWTTQIYPYLSIKRSRIGERTGLFACPSDESPTYQYIHGPRGEDPLASNATAMDKLRADTGMESGERRNSSRGGPQLIGDLIEPVSFQGSCDSLEEFRGGVRSKKLTELKRPHCFVLLTETKAEDTPSARCFRWADLIVQAKTEPDYKRHYGGSNPNSNGSNFLFADGHATWHSASYAANRMICCMQFGMTQFEMEAYNAQRSKCGDRSGGGSVPRRRQ